MNISYRYRWPGAYLLMSLFTACYMADAVASPPAGITLQSTRVIYPQEKKKGITFTLKNDTEVTYLIQSQVVNTIPGNQPADSVINPVPEAPFIVLPPLKRLDADEQLTLTIRQTKTTLPDDRESVFALQIKAIPAESDNLNNAHPGEVKVMLALQNTLKLFYRPKQLSAYSMTQIADHLRFSKQGHQLVVSNATPYYVTFQSLAIGDEVIDANVLFQMIPPFGQQMYSVSPSASGEVSWQLINDYGRASERYRRPLTH